MTREGFACVCSCRMNSYSGDVLNQLSQQFHMRAVRAIYISMADSRTLHTTWTMNDGGAVACLCPDGQTGKTLALHLKKINVQKAVVGGVLVPITSPSKRSQDVARPIADACLRELGDAWTLAAQLPVAKQHVPADSVEAALQAHTLNHTCTHSLTHSLTRRWPLRPCWCS